MTRKTVFRRPKKNKPSTKSNKKETQEITAIGRALRSLGSVGGGLAGSYLGAPVAGASVGHGLGAALSKWLGYGDYTVAKNSIVQKASNAIPMMHSTGQTIVVRHREFIGSISGSTSFQVQREIPLNPGIATSYPWLSGLADRYQEYKVLGMVYHYVPTSGTFNGTTAALGSVMIQTSYRATDSAPASKAELLNEYWATETVPYETMAHPIECDPKENPFAIHYVRTGITGVTEVLMYDMAKTFVATQGMADDSIVGDLWVTYEIELKKPLIASAVSSRVDYNVVTYPEPTTANYFLEEPVYWYGDFAGFLFLGKTITFPNTAARYNVVVRVDGNLSLSPSQRGFNTNPTTLNPATVTISSMDGNLTAAQTFTTVTGTGATVNSVFATFGVTTTGNGTVLLPQLDVTGVPTRIVVFVTAYPSL